MQSHSVGGLAPYLSWQAIMSQPLLIVDGEEIIFFAMWEYFTMHRYEVAYAQELDEAKALLAQARYALVICVEKSMGSGSETSCERKFATVLADELR